MLHEHENCCPEMQVSCVQCSKVVLRKHVQVSVVLHLLIIFIHILHFSKERSVSFNTMLFCGNLCYFQKVGKG